MVTLTGPYFDTTSLPASELAQATSVASRQDDIIYDIFRRRIGPFSPSHILTICQLQGRKWPITSVRRSMTNLTKRGLIRRTDEKVVGPYARPEYCWSLA
jgi:hypothetical protein